MVLYGKPGCHLCEDARRLIERAARRYPLQLTEIDIRRDPTLFRRYDIVIPVAVIDDSVELQTRITAVALRRALRRSRPRQKSG